MLKNDIHQFLIDYHKLYEFKPERLSTHKIVIANSHCKIVIIENKTSYDFFITDAAGKYEFFVLSILEFFHPDTDFSKDAYLNGPGCFLIMQKFLPKFFLKGEVDWEEVARREKYKTRLRQFIMNNFPIGHDLIHLLGSGHRWVENVEKCMNERGIRFIENS